MSNSSKPITAENQILDLLDREDLLKVVKRLMGGGIVVSFHGKRTAQEIDKKVRPRSTRIVKQLCIGDPKDQSENMIIEGENLQAMVTLYKYRGQVDLILTDPPYNTGQQFRYNDKWDIDPNDPDLGTLVTLEDGSRHTKWMKAMMPLLNMMKAMLKPNGVIAICIDENELFHLGMMMDEVFREENRIAIINWQKTYAAKSDSAHVSTSTEYILVYAKSKDRASTALLSRTEQMNARYGNDDGDADLWASDNLAAKAHKKPEDYGIQSPFTGEIHYPAGSGRWRRKKSEIKRILEQWGTPYVEMKDPHSTLKSLVLNGTTLIDSMLVTPQEIIQKARQNAIEVRDSQVWPELFFLSNGEGRPRIKRYLKDVKKGRVPMTYWADEDYDEPTILGTQSWDHTESGHSQTGITELDAIIGKGHGFQTVKPLRLFRKIIQLWCPPHGLVLDPYAGSGTTGHAVLELNQQVENTHRRFILVEQGAPEKGDKYARSLTQERLHRVTTGERPNGKFTTPIPGGFEFRMLTKQIDARVVLNMRKDELIDVVITSHWDANRRKAVLIRIEDQGFKVLGW
jgi:adenine-specific DNA-methyltransferase